MYLLIKTELKKMKRLKITYVGHISILLSALITCIQALTMSSGAVTFSDFTDMYLYNNALLFFPFMLALLGGYLIEREYALDTRKNLLVIPIKWPDMVKAKLFVLMFLTVYFSLSAASVSGLCGLLLGCPDLTFSSFFKKALSFLFSGVCICVGILPLILWFSRKKGTYLWGSVLSALLGITGVFAATGKFGNWHPVTYCFSIISDSLTVPTQQEMLSSAAAFAGYLLIAVLMYWGIYREGNKSRSGSKGSERGA